MSLKPNVDRILQANIAKPEPVCLSRGQSVHWLILSIAFSIFPIDKQALWPSKRASTIQKALQFGVALGVPIAHEDKVIILRFVKWDRDQRATYDTNATKTTSSAVQAGGRVVEVATDLILDLSVTIIPSR